MNKAQAIAEVKRLDYDVKKFEFDDLRDPDLSCEFPWVAVTNLTP